MFWGHGNFSFHARFGHKTEVFWSESESDDYFGCCPETVESAVLSFLSFFYFQNMFNKLYTGVKQHLTKLQTQSDHDLANNDLATTPTSQSCPPNVIISQQEGGSQPMTIGPPSGDAVRRRSSLFGIARNQHDDFVQKDLMASSWS